MASCGFMWHHVVSCCFKHFSCLLRMFHLVGFHVASRCFMLFHVWSCDVSPAPAAAPKQYLMLKGVVVALPLGRLALHFASLASTFRAFLWTETVSHHQRFHVSMLSFSQVTTNSCSRCLLVDPSGLQSRIFETNRFSVSLKIVAAFFHIPKSARLL